MVKVKIKQSDGSYLEQEMTKENLNKLIQVAQIFGQHLGVEVIIKDA
jgi:hypothetical protein